MVFRLAQYSVWCLIFVLGHLNSRGLRRNAGTQLHGAVIDLVAIAAL